MRDRSSRQDRRYAAIPNEAMRDIRVSIEARGLLALLMTYSDDWQFNKTHLLEVTKLGVNKFARVMKELEDAGYLQLRSDRNEKGQLLGRTWIIRDEAEHTENRVSDIRATEHTENRTHGKPNARKTTPIRRPIPSLKKTNQEENQSGEGDLFGDQGIEEPVAVDRFEEFWAAYPAGGRKSRKIAAAKFGAAVKRGADPDRIIGAAKVYAQTDQVLRGFAKHASTWLNGECWNDDDLQPQPIAQSSTGFPVGSPEDLAARRARMNRGWRLGEGVAH